MGLWSGYGTGPDEEEIFRLIDPDRHPRTQDETVGMQEEELLGAGSYDDHQEAFDEDADNGRKLAEVWSSLSADAKAQVARLVDSLLDD